MSYAELHCLSNFSFQRGASHPSELVEAAQALGYSALAITDECSMAGVVRAYEAARETSLRLIIGSEIQFQDGPKVVLLAKDAEGYSNLCKLITLGRRSASKGRYRLRREDCRDVEGLLPIWLPRWPAQGIPQPAFDTELGWMRERFGSCVRIAWERHLHPEDRKRLAALRRMSQRMGLPLLATGDVHYHQRSRQALQDVMTCVRAGCTLNASAGHLYPNSERHLRALPVLKKLYPADLLAEAEAAAGECRFDLGALRYEYPHELVPEGRTATDHLAIMTAEGARRRWPGGTPAAVQETIRRELALIAELGYEHFFLTVADIVQWARAQDILCQGRGSAANSVVCYCLRITEVDPGRMDLLFERFISKERGEPPDIDVDFEHQRREEAIQYVFNKYGRERAAIAATVISYRLRSAVRDVGKVLGLSLEQVDVLSKALAYWDTPDRLKEHLASMGYAIDGLLLNQFLQLVAEIRGMPRHLSQHVGGFVISQHPLHTLVPVENAAMPDRSIIQWDKDDLDVLGLLKVDLLALGMLSALHRAFDLIAGFRKRPFAMSDIPEGDLKTYRMIQRAETIGVFQIESRAQMSMLPRLKPENYWDLVVQVSLVRPGPIQGGMVHPYLRRRMGKETFTFPNRELEAVLGKTFGVPLFQEQVMSLAVVAAGFSPGEADQLRRAMAAWKRNGHIHKFRERLAAGMLARGYTAEYAEQVYQQILGFSGYGFPQSHAASFALLSYVSSWLKCHEPAAFCAALLNSQPMGFYAPAQLVQEARRNGGVRFLPIDVNRSDYDCTLEASPAGEPDVRLGLRMVSSLPEEEARRLVGYREGGYRTVDEMANRAGLSRRALDALAEAGALEAIAGHRHAARWAAAGVQRMHGVLEHASVEDAELELPAPTEGQGIVADYRGTGLTLGRHPLSLLRPRLQKLKVIPAQRLKKLPDGYAVRVAGLVTHRQRPGTASGVIFATLEDETGWSNLIIWPSVFEAQREAVFEAMLMVVRGRLQVTPEGVVQVVAREIEDYSAWLGELAVTSRDFR